MDLQVKRPVVTRARILLLALLAALFWLLFSLLGSSTPAVADDGPDADRSLLGSITSTIDEISPVPAVTKPVSAAVDRLIEPLEPVVAPVTQHPVVEPVTQAAEATLSEAAAVADAVLEPVLEPILEQPIVAETVQLLSGSAIDWADAFHIVPPGSAEASVAVGVVEPEPAAVMVIAATPDTWVAHVPAAGSLNDPASPDAPLTPGIASGVTLTQSAGSPTLLAALASAADFVAVSGASADLVHFAVPSSPTFDSDTSPD